MAKTKTKDYKESKEDSKMKLKESQAVYGDDEVYRISDDGVKKNYKELIEKNKELLKKLSNL